MHFQCCSHLEFGCFDHWWVVVGVAFAVAVVVVVAAAVVVAADRPVG